MIIIPAADRTKRGWRGVLRPGRLLWLRAPLWGAALVVLILASLQLLEFIEKFTGMPVHGPLSMIRLALAVLLALAAYAAAVRYGEVRPVTELAPRRLALELPAGVAAGIALFCLVMAVLLAGGWYHLEPNGPIGQPWRALGFGFGAGTVEELVFRGILMRLLWEAFGLVPAIAVSAAVFGLAHLLNPMHSVMGALSIIVEAGIMLGAIYALTSRLWLSIGAHAGWNFTQGWVFGTDVSGTDAGGHLLHAVQTPGAHWLLTGGAFGPEASLPGVAVGATAGGLVLIYVLRRNAAANLIRLQIATDAPSRAAAASAA